MKSEPKVQIKRKLSDPVICLVGKICPAVFELEDGDFLIVGKDITEIAKSVLPEDSGCGDGEQAVRVPKDVFLSAIPKLKAD